MSNKILSRVAAIGLLTALAVFGYLMGLELSR